MSPLLRIILILSFSIIGAALLLIVEKKKVDETYLLLLTLGFAFIDLQFTVASIKISPFLLITCVYLIRRYKLILWFYSRKAVLLLVAVVLIATIFSKYKSISFLTSFQRLFQLIPIAAGYSYFREGNFMEKVTKLVIPIVVYSVIFALIQLIYDPFFTLYYSVWSKEERLSLFYMDPQIAGCVTAILLVIIFNLYINSKKLLFLITLFVIFAIGCLTGSKTFLIGISLAITISFLRAKFSFTNMAIALTIVAVLFLTFNIWSQLPVFERMMQIEESLEVRSGIFWLGALEIFMKNPVCGIGPGSFCSYVEDEGYPLIHEVEGDIIFASQPESGYLLWLDEYGVLSAFIIGIMVYLLTRKGNGIINFTVFIPWMICFVSLYNYNSIHITFILALLVGALLASHSRRLAAQH